VQITDLAGVRVITYFPSTLKEIDEMLSQEFKIVERSDMGAELIEEDRFGYQSIHYLVKLTPQRARLPEYDPFALSIAEIQVRTILQHAWAEIEHDIQYKSASVIPAEIRRLLKKFGYRTLGQVEKCIRSYDDDALSRIASGSRHGQTTRFEYMLLAGMGENYIRRHLFDGVSWFGPADRERLEKFKSNGVELREYDPLTDVPDATAKNEQTAASSKNLISTDGASERSGPTPESNSGASDRSLVSDD